jgi:hypothetical protein
MSHESKGVIAQIVDQDENDAARNGGVTIWLRGTLRGRGIIGDGLSTYQDE